MPTCVASSVGRKGQFITLTSDQIRSRERRYHASPHGIGGQRIRRRPDLVGEQARRTSPMSASPPPQLGLPCLRIPLDTQVRTFSGLGEGWRQPLTL